MDLSVIILCYGAEESIVPFSKLVKNEVAEVTDQYEIILVGNYFEGSSDKTPEIIRQIAKQDPVFKAISQPKEGMMGWDLRMGLTAASGDYLCFVDGDGQFPVETISRSYKMIRTSNAGLVKTYRTKRRDGLQRKLISSIYNLVFKLLFPRINASDINSKPKIFSREVYELLHLSHDDWFIDAEIMIKAARLNIKVKEFPIEFDKLESRSSFVNFSTILEFARNLIKYSVKSGRI